MDNLATLTTLFAQKRVLDCGWKPERRFKVHLDKGVEFFTPAPPASKLTLDVSRLPLDVLRLIVTFFRTPAADAVAGGLFQLLGPIMVTMMNKQWTYGSLYENLDGWLNFRPINLNRRFHRGYFFQKTKFDYGWITRCYTGHLNEQLRDQARDRAYSFPRLTPRNELIWLRGQLALNNIHLPAHTRRKTMWKLFMAL
jgi:hypothetical protein